MRWFSLLVIAGGLYLAAPTPEAQSQAGSSGQFCTVDQIGYEDCMHLTMDACRRAAQFNRGTCFYRPAPQTPRSAPSYAGSNVDIIGSFERGRAQAEARRAAQQQRQEAEAQAAYNAEVRRLDLERRRAELARAQTSPPASSPASGNEITLGDVLGAALKDQAAKDAAIPAAVKAQCEPIRQMQVDAFLKDDMAAYDRLRAAYDTCVAPD